MLYLASSAGRHVFRNPNSSSSKRALSAAYAAGSNHHRSVAERRTALVAAMGVAAVAIDHSNHNNNGNHAASSGSSSCSSNNHNHKRSAARTTGVSFVGALSTSCDPRRIPSSGDVFHIGKITKEPATSISFPALCNGMQLTGVGVRVKYVFVKVYAVGIYMDPIAMMAVKKGDSQQIEKALLDPSYPRTIRIVMNRGLSVSKFIDAIVEAVEPRLKGKNLDTLEKFKELFPKVDLVEGDEVELTIRGDILLLKTALGVGSITSRPFTEAMCDVYFGKEPVSPTLKASVLKGIPAL